MGHTLGQGTSDGLGPLFWGSTPSSGLGNTSSTLLCPSLFLFPFCVPPLLFPGLSLPEIPFSWTQVRLVKQSWEHQTLNTIGPIKLLRMSADMKLIVSQYGGETAALGTGEAVGAPFSNYSQFLLPAKGNAHHTAQSHIANTRVSPSFQLCPLGSRPKSVGHDPLKTQRMTDPARARNAFQRLACPSFSWPTMVFVTSYPWEYPEGPTMRKDEGRIVGSKSIHTIKASPSST